MGKVISDTWIEVLLRYSDKYYLAGRILSALIDFVYSLADKEQIMWKKKWKLCNEVLILTVLWSVFDTLFDNILLLNATVKKPFTQ